MSEFSSPTRTELSCPPSPLSPSFHGYIATTVDAVKVALAARIGIIPRSIRRLTKSERTTMVKSGAIFVFSPQECGYWLGMKRWTDDISWCPSRMEGNFLIYREVTRQKRSANPKKDTITSASTTRSPISTAIEKRTPYSKSMAQVKQNGLMKKTITIRISGTEHHVICYFRIHDVRTNLLSRPNTRADIASLNIDLTILDTNNLRRRPKFTGKGSGIAVMDVEECQFMASITPQESLSAATVSSAIASLTSPPASTSNWTTSIPEEAPHPFFTASNPDTVTSPTSYSAPTSSSTAATFDQSSSLTSNPNAYFRSAELCTTDVTYHNLPASNTGFTPNPEGFNFGNDTTHTAAEDSQMFSYFHGYDYCDTIRDSILGTSPNHHSSTIIRPHSPLWDSTIEERLLFPWYQSEHQPPSLGDLFEPLQAPRPVRPIPRSMYFCSSPMERST